MEEYVYYVFQLVMMFVIAITVLSTCLLGCYKSMKSVRFREAVNETVAIGAHQNEEARDERDSSALDFNRGHERALPEIPPTLTGVGTSVEDEEEEDDSIYDIISRSKKSQMPVDNQAVLPGPSSSIHTKIRRQHPYEKVGGDTDGDSSNYGPPSRDPLYAGIKDVTEKSSENVHGTSVPTSAAAAASSSAASDAFYASPNTNVSRLSASHVQNPGALLTWGFAEGPLAQGQFPAEDSHDSSPGQNDVQSPLPLQNPSWSQNHRRDSREVQTSADQLNGTAASVPSDDHRVPNYSSVTARESLKNLRKRGQMLCDNQEEMYDTINYDAIKSGSRIRRSSAVLSSDHVYCTTGSDLYAEISAAGQSSSRSSTYAHVSDILLQSNSNFSLPNGSESAVQPSLASLPKSSLTDDQPSSSSTARSQCNPEFPIYSVINKAGRQSTFLPDDSESKTNQRFSRETNANFPRNCSSHRNELGNVDANRVADESLDSFKFEEKSKAKCKVEHNYSKIVFNKKNSSSNSSKHTGGLAKDNSELSVYDHIAEESPYEPVPVSLEPNLVNHVRHRSQDKIKLPWKEKLRKSSDEPKREGIETKKSKLINGYYCSESSTIPSNGVLSNDESSKVNTSPARRFVSNHFEASNSSRVDRNISKNGSTLGKSKFYVPSEILLEGGEVPAPCSMAPHTKNVPLREHIYELVNDTAYIDDDEEDDDDDVVLESDV